MQLRLGDTLYRVLEVFGCDGLAVVECYAISKCESVDDSGRVDFPTLGEIRADGKVGSEADKAAEQATHV